MEDLSVTSAIDGGGPAYGSVRRVGREGEISDDRQRGRFNLPGPATDKRCQWLHGRRLEPDEDDVVSRCSNKKESSTSLIRETRLRLLGFQHEVLRAASHVQNQPEFFKLPFTSVIIAQANMERYEVVKHEFDS
jgi:hypothetical protein